MKILFVTPAYAPAWTFGGVVSASHRLLREMALQGVDITVYTTDAGLPRDDEGARTGFRMMDGVKVHYFRCVLTNPIVSGALVKAARKTIGEFDLMHLAAVFQPVSIGVTRAAIEAGCPYVLAPHGSLDAWPRRRRRFKKVLYYLLFERSIIAHAAGFIATSETECDGLSRFLKRDQKVRTIPNGVSFQLWRRDPEGGRQWRREVGIPDESYLYLSVGRLHYNKGLELLIRALAPLKGRNWRLAFVGDDEDGTKVKLLRHARDCGVWEQISFHPTVSERHLPAIYSAGNLFVLPSYHENFGNVVLEALSCGCPVLISDQVAIYKQLNGIHGVVVRKRELSLWSEALENALTGGTDFITTASDGLELEMRFSASNCAAMTTDFYNHVIARCRCSR